ncbi:PQQ-binding-like beta-propeller repeat protein [Streptomyces sp. SID3343]|nr:PQQ-binding-like beta-propeller repeat protein [Streptomyces sp. SID3343]
MDGVYGDLHCLRADNGKSLWQRPSDEKNRNVRGDRPSGEVVFAPDGTILARSAGDLVAIDAAGGEIRWRVERPCDVNAHPRVAYATGLVIDNGLDRESRVAGTYADFAHRPHGDAAWRHVLAPAAAARTRPTNGVRDPVRIERRFGSVAEDWNDTSPTTPERHESRGNPVASAGLVFTTEIVRRGAVYLEAFVVALDTDTGEPRWRCPIPPAVHPSTPVVVDGTVYLTGDNFRVHALDSATGRVRWSALPELAPTLRLPAAEDGIPYDVNHTDASPVVSGGILYLASHDGMLRAYRTNDGTPLWSLRTGASDEPTSAVGTRAHPLPVVDGGIVYVYAEEDLVALESQDGRVRWRASTGWASVYPAPVLAGGLVHAPTDNGVMSLDPVDGRRVRHLDVGGRARGLIAGPETLYIGGPDGIHAADLP